MMLYVLILIACGVAESRVNVKLRCVDFSVRQDSVFGWWGVRETDA
jgi:hypothetical protein